MKKEIHQHNLQDDGCCSQNHSHHHNEDDQDHGDSSALKIYFSVIFSLVLLLIGIALDYFKVDFFSNIIRISWYLLAYLPVSLPVIKEAFNLIVKGEIFTEFLLMVLATIGALALGEYPEAVAVMLFYTIGELFQGAAVNKAKSNIKALLDVRPDTASVFRNDKYEIVKPETVEIGEIIQLKVGEKAPLDGELINESASFNTAALTGESTPKILTIGETVLAGMLNIDKVITLKVSKNFEDSALSRILEMVQTATSRKAKTELFIRKFAKIYTPIVFFLAVALTVIPYFIVAVKPCPAISSTLLSFFSFLSP